MKYNVDYSPRAIKELQKLNKYTRNQLISWIEKNLVGCDNPRLHGRGLTANKSGLWRYRVGDYRLIAEIHDNTVTILIMEVGHRSSIYQ